MLRPLSALACGLACAVANPSFAQHAEPNARPTIVEAAASNDSFETLVAAVRAAGLVDTLQGEGPFTVFAPTDEAFAALPAGTLDHLLERQNRPLLRAILTYHVRAGALESGALANRRSLDTVNGQRLSVSLEDGLTVGGATLLQADLRCRNGVIHVIDRVLIPTREDLITLAVEAGSFETLAAALQAAGLVEALQGEGPFTVFAPTDEAFAKLDPEVVEALLQPRNLDALRGVLTYHVVAGRVYRDQALAAGSAETLQGQAVGLRLERGKLKVNDATVVRADLQASNGVIHVIDRVLLPDVQIAMGPTSPALDLIERAVERGAPLFNAGQPEACAYIYELTARSLLALSSELSENSREALRGGLRRFEATDDAHRQAWVLRRALDLVFEQLQAQPTQDAPEEQAEAAEARPASQRAGCSSGCR